MTKAEDPVPNASTTGNSPIANLPFAEKAKRNDQPHRRFWVVAPSGDWTKDVLIGQAFAAAYLEALRSNQAPPLSWITRDMIAAGQFTGIESGFMSAVSSAAAQRGHQPFLLWLTREIEVTVDAMDALWSGVEEADCPGGDLEQHPTYLEHIQPLEQTLRSLVAKLPLRSDMPEVAQVWERLRKYEILWVDAGAIDLRRLEDEGDRLRFMLHGVVRPDLNGTVRMAPDDTLICEPWGKTDLMKPGQVFVMQDWCRCGDVLRYSLAIAEDDGKALTLRSVLVGADVPASATPIAHVVYSQRCVA